MGSIMMMFGAFTSAYIVRRAAGDWLEFQLPNLFFVSTLVILISSLVLHMSFSAFVSGREQRYKNLMITAFILGVGFVVLQYLGWQELFSIGIDLKGNPSGAFLYMITGVHALHVVGGLVALTIGLLTAFTRPYRITEKRKINFELTLQYWHFVDLLWVYLLLFLFLSR
ncbi:MAG: cytochrome c oxidase subunit 3 [Bacteroidota bacterium]